MSDFIGMFMGCVLVGALGVCMMVTRNPVPLHSYHRATTPACNLPKLAWWSGLGALFVGIGGVVMSLPLGADAGVLPAWMGSPALPVVGAAIMVAALVETVAVIIRYNGTLFS